MQLSKLTDCYIEMKIYNSEDKTLLEYTSDHRDKMAHDFGKLQGNLKLSNDDFSFIEKLEQMKGSVTKF